MAKHTASFTAVTWADLMETLEQLSAEGPLQEVGTRVAEVTDLVQSQLFSQHPMLALRMSRVIELRFTSLSAVAYLRTGIPVGQESASPDAGAFLLALRWFNHQTGEYVFLRSPRVKRLANWRQNLRRRLRDLCDDLQEGTAFHARREARSLAELLEVENDDLEAGLDWTKPKEGGSTLWTSVQAGRQVSAAHMRFGDLQAAGVSLPVWVSVFTSLGLVLAVLLGR